MSLLQLETEKTTTIESSFGVAETFATEEGVAR